MEGSLRILLADDEDSVRETISGYLRELGQQVDDVSDGIAALKSMEAVDYDLGLVDVRMPGMDGFTLLKKVQEIRPELSFVIITGHGSMEMAIQALRMGAADFLTKPVKLLELDAVLEKAMRIRELRQDRRHLRETIGGIQASDDIRTRNRSLVGSSTKTKKLRAQIRQAVEAKCETILITGETGTGKEVVAREIHFQGSSDDRPFIAVSCPALLDSLVESELFGHVKGSFTGATGDRAGYFELSDEGTLFLDEVADLSSATQAALLRVLETRTLRRVGGAKEISVDIRVIAATNAPLESYVDNGKFRRDLFYRLNVFSIHLSPLKERRDDIMPLAEHFLSIYSATRGLEFDGFSPDTKKMLMEYHFPGNARELRNLVERAAILSRSGQIQAEHFNLPEGSGEAAAAAPSLGGDHHEQERSQILNALEAAKWNRRQAAKDLGMPYSTLRYKLQKFGIT